MLPRSPEIIISKVITQQNNLLINSQAQRVYQKLDQRQRELGRLVLPAREDLIEYRAASDIANKNGCPSILLARRWKI